uniref:Ubiquitin carboxyl-terminal hydrolase n=1 Tax=Meloidogyne hapla TaxID=6305 RepID=A0A1I8BX90_MELHA
MATFVKNLRHNGITMIDTKDFRYYIYANDDDKIIWQCSLRSKYEDNYCFALKYTFNRENGTEIFNYNFREHTCINNALKERNKELEKIVLELREKLAQKRPITPDEIPADISSKTIIPCLKGLLNHGNTCYFSAVIQCLAACERLAENLICDESEASDLANKYLACDALEKMSGTRVMDLFRGQLRVALKCTNPVCGFANLSFEPYVCISLSVPLERKLHHHYMLFFSLRTPRQIIRFCFAVSEASLTVKHFNNNIMKHMNGSADETVSCIIKRNGLMQLIGDDFSICADNRLEINIFEIPKQFAKHDMIICLVVFVIGTLPHCERFENPFVARLSKHWNYATISKFLLKKSSHILPHSFQPSPQDYKIFVQGDNSLEALNPLTKKPLFHAVERILNDINNPKKILRIIIEWDLSLKQQLLSNVAPEPILNNYTFTNQDASKQFPISLKILIDEFVESESIRDWACPKCKKSPGSMELSFQSLPDVLVFHLKRFEVLSEGVIKKIDSRVKTPLENLDMSPYVYNQHSKSSTLPKNKNNSMIYDLTGVIYHSGERTNSGHYTAATRNPVDKKWRIFDDSRVSDLADSFTGASELQISSRSYLLFYQRRHLVHRKLNWFPQNVPEIL